MANIKLEELDPIIEKHSEKKGNLIPVLNDIQKKQNRNRKKRNRAGPDQCPSGRA